MSYSDLSSDVIGHIMSYLMPYPFERKFMQLRLLNKATDLAIRKYRPYWVDILVLYGPKQIGTHSKHRVFVNRNMCKININGQCRIASHYHKEELEPVYDKHSNYGAFDAVMKWIYTKARRRAKKRFSSAEKLLSSIIEVSLPMAEVDVVRTRYNLTYIEQWKKKKRKKN